MVTLKLSGEFYKRVKSRGRVYRGFFVVIADGKIVLDLGRKSGSGVFSGSRELEFERSVTILGKTGPTGLEGSLPDGGKWVLLRLAPSGKRRRLSVRLPVVEGEEIRLDVSGFFDLQVMDMCRGCRYGDLLDLNTANE